MTGECQNMSLNLWVGVRAVVHDRNQTKSEVIPARIFPEKLTESKFIKILRRVKLEESATFPPMGRG